MAFVRAFKTFIENALFITTNGSSIYITYIFFSSLSNYICHADPSTTAFENLELQSLWTHREGLLKWCSVACYLVYVCETGARVEEEDLRKDSTHFPIIAWGVHFEAAMYIGGYLAGLCVLRLMYDVFVTLRVIMGIIGICGIVVFLARKRELQGGEETKVASSKLSPGTHLNEVLADEIDGDCEFWGSDGMLTPPSTPDLDAYGEDFEYEEWDCWAE